MACFKHGRGLSQALLRRAPLGNVLHDADDPARPVGGLRECPALQLEPALLTTWAPAAKLDLAERRIAEGAPELVLDPRTVLLVHQRQHVFPTAREDPLVDSEDPVGHADAQQLAARGVQFPRSHLGGVERQTQPLLAMAQGDLGGTPLQHHLDGGVELARREWLEQIAVCTRRARPRQRRLFGVCGQIDDRHAQLGRYARGRFDTVDVALDVDVHQHQIRVQTLDLRQSPLAGCGDGHHVIAELAQLLAKV